MPNPNAAPGRESKPHIGIYGRCNAGKSSLLNFITEGETALVSPEPGTTTDPVRKSYEILDFAPVIFIDTAGLDDVSSLGEKRIERTLQTLSTIDLALLVFRRWSEHERSLLDKIEGLGLPYLLIYNGHTSNELAEMPSEFAELPGQALNIDLDAPKPADRDELLAAIRRNLPESSYKIPSLFEGLVTRGDTVLLVCPVDSEAPTGRLILPQVQAIRALLDLNAIAVTVQPEQIGDVLAAGIRPSLVVTDSQAFAEVKRDVPEGIPVTSFSILLARSKGDIALYSAGLEAVDRLRLKNGDRVLILENCLHQSTCEDIGRVKIPAILKKHTGSELEFEFISGLSPLPKDLPDFSFAVQCGGCMVTRIQLQNRIRAVAKAGVPVTNYGMLLNKLL